MVSAEREQTHRDMIQLIARKIGNHLKPADYIEAVYDRFGVNTSSSSITKALGSYVNRLRSDEKHLLKLGKDLIDECHGDRNLARYILNKAKL